MHLCTCIYVYAFAFVPVFVCDISTSEPMHPNVWDGVEFQLPSSFLVLRQDSSLNLKYVISVRPAGQCVHRIYPSLSPVLEVQAHLSYEC